VSIAARTVRRVTMRFMMMHKHDPKADPQTEAGAPPPPELVAAMETYIAEQIARGTFLGGEGLGSSATRTRLTFRGGRCTIKHGPYQGEHELPAAALLIQVRSRDEAIGWAERYGKILGDGELELGPVTEAWDLGLMAKPDDPPLRVLVLEKADAASEAGTRSAKQKADLARLRTEMTKAGVLISAERLQPSARGKRVFFANNDLRIVDGPFTESKELIGGYAFMRFPSMEAAVEQTRRYVNVLGGPVEVDIRPVEEPDEEPGSVS
jgi:hypothetical protein